MSSALDHPKILTLRKYLARSPTAFRRTIVFTNGCFDLLHAGHVDLLRQARAHGDALVVGLNSDASVRRLKGPSRPIIPLAERAYVLSGLESVDCIVPFAADTPLELILAIKPQVLIKGGDWPVERIVGAAEVQSWGGRVFSLPLLPGYSTTAIVSKIRSFPCSL